MDLTLGIVVTPLVLSNILFDLMLAPPGLETGEELQSAVIISLFTDRRANKDDPLSLDESRRGWWADTYLPGNDKYGSRLWLLRRAKMLDATLVNATEYCQEALRWLITDNVASKTTVDANFIVKPRTAIMTLEVGIQRPSGSDNFNFQYAWNDIKNG